MEIQDRAVAGWLALFSKKTISQSESVLISATANPTAAKVEAAWYLLEGLYNNNINIFTQDANLRTNSDAFYVASSNSLEKAVNDSDKGQNRVKFIDPLFERNNSYRASNSFLWEYNSDLKTNDFQYQERAELVEKTYALDLNPLDQIMRAINRINPIAHPNRKGAKRYADMIISVIDGRGLSWLDNSYPTVQSFQVTPQSLTFGESFTIDYTVLDNVGSGLKQVELWRTQEKDKWPEWPENPIQTNNLAGETGPLSGSFTDSPPAPGTFWYGVHVVDNAGNWNDERNSNTNYQPVSFEPVEVDISGIAADKELSQAPLEDWNVTFGGPYTDLATSIQLTSDGGYIIAGNTVSKDAKGAAGKDNWQIAWLIKTDSCGNELWNRSFYGEKTIFDDWYLDGDISDHYFVANSAQQTSDGGYILAGYTQPYHVGYFNDWMIKTDSVGNEIWSKYFGGGYRGGIKRFMPTLDDGYILIGTLYPGFASGNDVAFLIKTNSTGDEIWYKRFGVGYGHNYGSSVQTTNDGGYILAGNRIYDGIAWLIKTDSEGNELWNKTFGKARGDEVSSVKLMVDGGFVLAGSTISYSSGGRDAWLIKTDSEGNELWNKTFGGAHDEVAVSAQPTPDGGTVLAGDTYSFGSGRSDAWLIKTDSEGNELWNRTFGGADSDGANSVQLTFDGGYILAGETRSFGAGGYDAWLIKLAPI